MTTKRAGKILEAHGANPDDFYRLLLDIINRHDGAISPCHVAEYILAELGIAYQDNAALPAATKMTYFFLGRSLAVSDIRFHIQTAESDIPADARLGYRYQMRVA